MSGPSGEALVEKAEIIRTKADFAAFVDLLLLNFHDHPEEWDNNTLVLFLQGLAGFVGSMEGYYSNVGVEVDLNKPGWRVLADILMAARVYE